MGKPRSFHLATRMQLADARMFRESGHQDGVARIAAGVRARLFDLSAFMKEFKMRMTLRDLRVVLIASDRV